MGGGSYPLWFRDRSELLFETRDQGVMAVVYTPKTIRSLRQSAGGGTETRLRGLGNLSSYDLAPDGKRLAAMLADDANAENPATHLTFLLNFFDELRRRAPASK
jgi:eukaryotic-like serine/threonine-protein kinase